MGPKGRGHIGGRLEQASLPASGGSVIWALGSLSLHPRAAAPQVALDRPYPRPPGDLAQPCACPQV